MRLADLVTDEQRAAFAVLVTRLIDVPHLDRTPADGQAKIFGWGIRRAELLLTLIDTAVAADVARTDAELKQIEVL